MLAYRQSKITKTMFLKECERHQEEDRFRQRVYWDSNLMTGCAIGCAYNSIATLCEDLPPMTYSTAHRVLSEHLGIEEDVLRVEDHIFEALPWHDAICWPLRFAEAVPDGADTSGVVAAFIRAALEDVYEPSVPAGSAWWMASRRVRNGIDAGWRVPHWVHFQTEIPKGAWELPFYALNYLLAAGRGETFVRSDSLYAILYRVTDGPPGYALWAAVKLLEILRAAPVGV